MYKKYDVIVIGGGPAGITAANTVKRIKSNWKVALIRSQKKSVIPCALPYALDNTIKIDDYVKDDEKLIKGRGIDLYIMTVSSIDVNKKVIYTSGKESFAYEYLILCIGSKAVYPSIEGMELKNVFVVKDHPDILRIKSIIDEGKRRFAVIGAGFIGLELVGALYNLGKEVYLIERERFPLPSVVSGDMGEKIFKELEVKGINLFFNDEVLSLEENNKEIKLKLKSDNSLNVDSVIFCVGVRPNVKLAQDAGLEVDRWGIVVDEYMRTSDPYVYAAGDCARCWDFFTKQPTNSYLATTAVIQAKIASFNIVGRKRKYKGTINPAITRIFDISLGSVGIIKEKADRKNISVVIGESLVHTREKSFGGGNLFTRLIFDSASLKLLGAEVISSECIAYIINMLSLAILNGLDIYSLAEMQYCGHPPQVDVPSKMHIVLAAEDALKKI